MDDTLLPKLREAIHKIIAAADADGSLDRGELSQSLARQTASKALGLGKGGLEEKEWKRKVKEMINEEIDKLSGREDENEGSVASGSRSPQTAPKAKRSTKKTSSEKRKKQATPASSPSPSLSPVSSRKPTAQKSKQSKRLSREAASSSDGDDDGKEGSEDDVPKKDNAAASESEMSSVYDVAPTRKKRKSDDTGNEKKKSKTTKRKKKDPNEGLSTEEAKVADLKRIVVACGVRKQWGKEFADHPTPKDQARHLERMLIELGMKGKPSIGKAKTLKEQRELAAELNDVRQFEATRGVSAAERKSKQRKRSDTAEDDDEPKPQSALAAVLDFFDDESD